MPLIVLEGLDGAGKSTQIKLLTEYFNQQQKDVYFLHFPRLNSPYFGDLISTFLRGEFGDIDQVHPKLVALLYAGDRWSASSEIKSYLEKDYIVLLDRYVYSNLAYQCAKILSDDEKQQLREWILQFEFDFFKIPRPDINIFLDVPLSFVKQKLIERRQGDNRTSLKGKTDIHEKSIRFQEKVRNEYLYLCNAYDLLYVDCTLGNKILPPNNVFQKIVCILEEKLNENK